jgi:hypothetical protein
LGPAPSALGEFIDGKGHFQNKSSDKFDELYEEGSSEKDSVTAK